MKRFKLDMTSMHWAVVLDDLRKIKDPEDSTTSLRNLILLGIESMHDDTLDLPFNIDVYDS